MFHTCWISGHDEALHLASKPWAPNSACIPDWFARSAVVTEGTSANDSAAHRWNSSVQWATPTEESNRPWRFRIPRIFCAYEFTCYTIRIYCIFDSNICITYIYIYIDMYGWIPLAIPKWIFQVLNLRKNCLRWGPQQSNIEHQHSSKLRRHLIALDLCLYDCWNIA